MKCYHDQIPECYVLSAKSGKAQIWRKYGFDPAALFDACEINHDISLDKYGIKRSRKRYSTNICHSSPYIYFHVK